MNKRHNKLGIKQTIRNTWMDRTVQMMLAGMRERDIRSELDEFLSTQKQSGGTGERGVKTYGMAIGILSSWFSPDPDLVPLRDNALKLAGKLPPEQWLPLHWAVVSASYPFWFSVAKQVGRLLSLQEQVTQPQVFGRLKEQYGDRIAVARNARYTVRSFVAWKILKDCGSRGCYEKPAPIIINNQNQAILLIESALHAIPEEKGTMGMLLGSPAFFPFELPFITGDVVAQHCDHITVMRYGSGDDMLMLKG